MIITSTSPFSLSQVEELKSAFEVYIKTVIDLEKGLCSAGCNMHYESEQTLLSQGSSQSNVWGGGIDLNTKVIDFNSMINIRPTQNNFSNEIQDQSLRAKFEKLTKYFFPTIYGS